MTSCEVCELLAAGEEPIIETMHWRVGLADDQTYLGRAFVTLKTHVGSLSVLSTEQWQELHGVIRRYETACREAFGARLFNWGCLMNNTFKTAEPAPHVHWHVRPRYDRPVTVAGEAFQDEAFGHHYEWRTERRVAPEVMAEIAERLRAL